MQVKRSQKGGKRKIALSVSEEDHSKGFGGDKESSSHVSKGRRKTAKFEKK